MDILNESEQIQRAIEASLLKDQEAEFENNLISLDPKSNEDGFGTKSKSRKRSKQRGIIDDDEDEGDIAVDVNKVVNDNKGNIFGSDDQNYNQNNIDYEQGIEMKLNRDALFDVEDKELKSGKKSA